jgi:hypothetical protein
MPNSRNTCHKRGVAYLSDSSIYFDIPQITKRASVCVRVYARTCLTHLSHNYRYYVCSDVLKNNEIYNVTVIRTEIFTCTNRRNANSIMALRGNSNKKRPLKTARLTGLRHSSIYPCDEIIPDVNPILHAGSILGLESTLP